MAICSSFDEKGMNRMNALQIQQTLVGRDYVSIPWIQNTYGLPYSQAKEFLAQLQLRGWVEKKVQGTHYLVRKENLQLRRLERKEVDSLIRDVSYDCGCVLRLLKKGKCADFGELESTIDDADDTIAAIEVLEKHKLIYRADGVYFSCLSDKEADVLVSLSRQKRHGFFQGEDSDDLGKIRKMRLLFNALFDGEEE